MSKDNFNLRLEPSIKDELYKHAQVNDKSINKSINRMLNHALMSEKIYFEMQYLDQGERFGFKDDHDDNNEKAEKIIYRFQSVDKNNGDYICTTRTGRVFRFKFKDVFYKLIFTI